ncbi:MAG: 4Fe-4S binding protein [candidate division WOR-3 bacterium]
MTVATRRFEVIINEKWCKGCEICVVFCPKKVLAMEKTKAKVVNPDACTGCQLCEIYCPDFAIEVEKL